jgi:hypothetical protein
MEVRDMGYTDSRCPKPRNAEKICVVDLRGDLTVGFLLGMDVGAWMCTTCQRIEKTGESGGTRRRHRWRRGSSGTCHAPLRLRATVVVGPENKVNRNFGFRGL